MNFNDIIKEVKQNTNWKSESRIIGQASEIYIEKNINCIMCKSSLEMCKVNEKSYDLICINCSKKYQIKSKKISEKSLTLIKNKKSYKLVGGDYKTTINNISKKIDYIVVFYKSTIPIKSNLYTILDILYTNCENITEECIIPRTPLSVNARRAGWQGCNIILNNLHSLIIEY
jgi:type II restriction enzyme